MTVPKRFGVLRFFGTLLKVIAWIILILSVLAAVGAALAGSTMLTTVPGLSEQAALAGALGTAGPIVAGIFVLIIGLVYFLILYVSGESMHLQLAVEENTRLTAALLLRMHQEGQGESGAPYGAGGGFVNEPFDN